MISTIYVWKGLFWLHRTASWKFYFLFVDLFVWLISFSQQQIQEKWNNYFPHLYHFIPLNRDYVGKLTWIYVECDFQVLNKKTSVAISFSKIKGSLSQMLARKGPGPGTWINHQHSANPGSWHWGALSWKQIGEERRSCFERIYIGST